MTWKYGSEFDELPPEQLPTEWVWERLRAQRDQLLTATDFRMVADAPWDQAPWVTYREALRDLPDATTDPRVAVWPVQP